MEMLTYINRDNPKLLESFLPEKEQNELPDKKDSVYNWELNKEPSDLLKNYKGLKTMHFQSFCKASGLDKINNITFKEQKPSNSYLNSGIKSLVYGEEIEMIDEKKAFEQEYYNSLNEEEKKFYNGLSREDKKWLREESDIELKKLKEKIGRLKINDQKLDQVEKSINQKIDKLGNELDSIKYRFNIFNL